MISFDGDLSTLMKLGFYIVSLFYVIFSVVLYYHWMEYAVDEKVRNISLSIYFLTTLPLLSLMGLMFFIA